MTERKQKLSFSDLPESVRKKTEAWIRENLRAVPWNNRYVTTYGLLDVLDTCTGISLSAHQFNEAMQDMGFTPRKSSSRHDIAELSWNWNVGLTSPYFRKTFR